MIAHSYEAVVTAPTCTEGGFTTYTCTVCGDSYVDDETDALGHNYEATVTAPTCTEGGFTTYTCTVCDDSYVDDYTDVIAHSYEAVVTAPTCTEGGFTTYTCTVCGDSYVGDETAALGHSFENGVCTGCGEIDKTEYKVNTLTKEVVYDDGGNAYLVITAKNMDLAGILFRIHYGNYKPEHIELPENATAYDVGGYVNYVFSDGVNTEGEMVLMKLHLDYDGVIDPDEIAIYVNEIYRFTENGDLEIPEYTVVTVR